MQDDLFSELEPGSFDGIAMPVVSVQLTAGTSAASHKYPHRPGQKLEYTGREPIAGQIVAAFFNDLSEEGGTRRMWPTGLNLLRARVQEQRSGKLVLPTHGTIPKAMLRIAETYEPGVREGAFVTLTFEEDNADDVIAGLGVTSGAASMARFSTGLENQLARLNLRIGDLGVDIDGNGYGSLSAAIAGLTGNLARVQSDLARAVSQATGLVRRLDDLLETATVLGDPGNWEVRDALLDLRDAITSAVTEAISGTRAVRVYAVAGPMTMAQVATDAKNTLDEVLALNVVSDGNRLVEGDELLVYVER